MGELKKNFLYNIIYQVLVFILPLITIPYVSRVLGATGVGQYSYTYSIVYYFMILAMLGLNNYGNRTIARVRDDKSVLSKNFKEIHLLQIITSSVMLILYLIYSCYFNEQYKLISFIQCIYVLSCMFDINWFFFGIEKFKLTVTRNTIIKIISLILIFIFVKDSNDVWIYTLILSGSTLLSHLLLWPFVKKYIDNVKINISDMKKHFIPCLKLLLPVIAVAIYKMMDKTMIGILANVDEVGLYENAEKIITVPSSIIGALGTVMLPRMSNIYGKGDNLKAEKMIEKSMTAMMFMGFAMVFGLMAVSNDFSILYFGTEFAETGKLIFLLAITSLFVSWGNVIRTQYLIPKEMDKEYITSAFLGAIVNLIMNLIFIPLYGAVGACYGTIGAEFIVVFYQTFSVRNYLPIRKYIVNIFPFFVKGLLMFIIVILIGKLEINMYLRLIIQILSGMFIYGILNIKYVFNLLNKKKEGK